jgi:hypothetical protein
LLGDDYDDGLPANDTDSPSCSPASSHDEVADSADAKLVAVYPLETSTAADGLGGNDSSGNKRKLKPLHPARARYGSNEYERARKKRMHASARMAAYRDLCKQVAAATVDKTNVELVIGAAPLRSVLGVQKAVASLFNALNCGIVESVVKCVNAYFSEKSILRTRLVKYGEFTPFTDRAVYGKSDIIGYFRAFADCFPDGVWNFDIKQMKKGLSSITNDFTFTGSFDSCYSSCAYGCL